MTKEITPPDRIPVGADNLQLTSDFCASVVDTQINRNSNDLTSLIEEKKDS